MVRRIASAFTTSHPKRSKPIRKAIRFANRKPALSEAEGDPLPVQARAKPRAPFHRPLKPCHLERSEGIRPANPFAQSKDPMPACAANWLVEEFLPRPSPDEVCTENSLPVLFCRQQAWVPSTAHDRPSDAHAPLGMTEPITRRQEVSSRVPPAPSPRLLREPVPTVQERRFSAASA